MPKNRADRTAFFPPWRLGPLLVASILSGCALQPLQDPAALLASVPAAELSRLSDLEQRGEIEPAARRYLELAAQASDPAKTELRLQAARTYLAGGRLEASRQVLDTIETTALAAGQLERARLLKAELALAARQPRMAITELNRLGSPLPKPLKARQLGLLAAAQRLDNQPLAAAVSLTELDRLLDGETRLANQVALVATLALLGDSEQRTLAQSGRRTLKGWLEIAQLVQRVGADPARLEDAYRQWHGTHASHPALPELARAYASGGPGGYTSDERLTVMLPSGGRFATAARAVRDGIETAERADPGAPRPRLDFADSTQASRVRALHDSALQRGSGYVIGPLEKPAVDALGTAKTLRVPTLALNESTATEPRTPHLFQFALSPENEAAEAANKGLALGAKHALILHPNDAWGRRLASAFAMQWRQQGGTLGQQASFDPAASRHDSSLSRLLEDRKVDLVFLAATAEMARRLHPQIQAAAKKPLIVISTSHVYSGRFDANSDKALVGLYFVDIPWMLDLGGAGPLARRTIMGQSASASGPLARLYAMGIDAYRLTPRLPELAANPGAYFPGQTGGLAVDPLGRITRQLALGRFTENGPRLANGADRPRETPTTTRRTLDPE